MFTFWHLFAFPFTHYECVRLWSKPTKISFIIIRCDVEHFTWKCVLIMKLQIENQVKGKGRVSHNPSWPAFFLFFVKYLFCSLVWDFLTDGVFSFFEQKSPVLILMLKKVPNEHGTFLCLEMLQFLFRIL